MGLMRLGQVRVQRRDAFRALAGMDGDALALVQHLHRSRAQAHVHARPDQAVRDAVAALLDLDVVLDADLGMTPFGIRVGHRRQGFESNTYA